MAATIETIRQHARLLISEVTDDRYNDSFGEKMSDLVNKRRWQLAGTASQEWNETLFPLIQGIMGSQRKEIYQGENIADHNMICLCYMLGHDEMHAHPTVVVACDGKGFKGILRRTMRAIHRVSEFAQKGFKLMGLRLPDLKMKAYLEHCSARIPGFVNGDTLSGPASLCGQQITANGTQRRATIGGTIIADGSYFALTVAHVFLPVSPTEIGSGSSTVESFDLDWAMDSDGEEDSAYDSGSESVESGNSQEPNLVSEESLETHTPSGNVDRSRELRIQRADSSLDWAAMRVDDHTFYGVNEVQLGPEQSSTGNSWAYLLSMSPTPARGEVMVASRDGTVKAHCDGNSWTGKLKGSEVNTTIWAIRTNGYLPEGVCGSWVFDAKSHQILGYIVSGSDILQEAFLVPLIDLIESVKRLVGATEVRLPTREDSLWLAVYFGNTYGVEKLLKDLVTAPNTPSEVPIQNPVFQSLTWESMTMLHWSARQGFQEISELLIKAGADVNATTKTMKTPLHFAVHLDHDQTLSTSQELKKRKRKVVEILLNVNGIEVNARDNDGNTPLMLAKALCFSEAEELIERHPDSESNEFPERFYYPTPSATTDNEYQGDADDIDLFDTTAESDPTKEWTWHPDAQDYYMKRWQGGQWSLVWAKKDVLLSGGQTSALTSAPTERPNTGSPQPLDHSFSTQAHPRKFFTQGRMFAVLFTEAVGSTPGTETARNVSTIIYGEQILSNIRRFIVVQEGHGFCYACPVSTYGGRGTAEKGLNPNAHAVVYTPGCTPRYVAGEEPLEKTPMLVVPADSALVLAASSRINFAIHHPIHHNVKARNIGMVHPSLIPTLVKYAKLESGWD